MFFLKNLLIFNFVYICSYGVFLFFKKIFSKQFSSIKDGQIIIGLAIILILMTIPISVDLKSISIVIISAIGLLLNIKNIELCKFKTEAKNYFLALTLFLFASIPILLKQINTATGYLICNDLINHLAIAGQDIGQNFLKTSFESYPRGFHYLLNIVSFVFGENDLFYLFSPTLLSVYAISIFGIKQIFKSTRISFLSSIGLTYLSFAQIGFAGQIIFQVFYYSLIGSLFDKKNPNWIVISLLLAASIISYGIGSILWLAPTLLIINLFNKYKFKKIIVSIFLTIVLVIFTIPRIISFYKINKNVSLNEGNIQRFIPIYQLSGLTRSSDYRGSVDSVAMNILFIAGFALAIIFFIYKKDKHKLILISIVCGNTLFFSILNGYYIWSKNISVLTPITIGILLSFGLVLSRKNKLILSMMFLYQVLIIYCSYKTSSAIPIWPEKKYSELKKINILLTNEQSILFLDFFDAARLAIPKTNLDTPFNQYLKGKNDFDETNITDSSLKYEIIIISLDMGDLNRFNLSQDSKILKNLSLALANYYSPIYEGNYYLVLKKDTSYLKDTLIFDKNYQNLLQEYEENNQETYKVNLLLLKDCKYIINKKGFYAQKQGIYSYVSNKGNFTVKSTDNCSFMLLNKSSSNLKQENVEFIRDLIKIEDKLIHEKSNKD